MDGWKPTDAPLAGAMASSFSEIEVSACPTAVAASPLLDEFCFSRSRLDGSIEGAALEAACLGDCIADVEGRPMVTSL